MIAFRDAASQFETANAVILGVSPDDQGAQSRFSAKHGLPYPMLCDTDHVVAEAYGAWTEKTNYGKKYMGIQRSTFVIDPEGMVAKVYPKVNIEGHAAEVLEAIRALK